MSSPIVDIVENAVPAFKNQRVLNDTIYALHNVYHGQDVVRMIDVRGQVFASIPRRRAYLDGLAALLTRSENDDDAVATHLFVSRKDGLRYHLLWARTGQAKPSPEESNYVKSLLPLLRPRHKKYEVYEVVVEYCRPRLTSLLRSVVSLCGSSSTWDDPFAMSKNPSFHFWMTRMRRKGWLPVTNSFSGLQWPTLGSFLETNESGEYLSRRVLADAVMFCSALNETRDTMRYLTCRNEALLDVIGEIALYAIAIRKVRYCLSRYPHAQISAEFVPSPSRNVTVSASTLEALNNFALADSRPSVKDFERILRSFPDATPGAPPEYSTSLTKTLEAGQHAVTTMAIHLLLNFRSLQRQQRLAVIGSAKPICMHCARFLMELNQKRPDVSKILVIRGSYHRPETWLFPSAEDIWKECSEREIKQVGVEICSALAIYRKDVRFQIWDVIERATRVESGAT